MLQCYNRGCGQKFDPAKNSEDSCMYHPGEPFFHDAYKGWTCCNKKSVDFTEFLNMKGCTLSKHSNDKPPEPEKTDKNIEFEEPEILPPKPIKQSKVRPPFETKLTEIEPSVVPALKEAIDSLKPKLVSKTDVDKPSEIPFGTNCKNGGCTCKYSSPESDDSECQYHPGVPIFHEGMKYWSCCNKKTSDFTTFMNQPGCTYGKHKWIKEDDDTTVVNCRYDWHQTPSNVIVAIYAKLYHYSKSKVKVNPVRLNVCLIFPDQSDAEFNMDLELRGIIDVEQTTVKMYPTKIEITMPKAEAGSWSNLDFPRVKSLPKNVEKKPDEKSKKDNDSDSDSDFNLDDIEPISGVQISDIS